MTEDNEIIEEIRNIRAQMLEEYGGDMSAYLTDMRRRTEELAKAGRVVVTRSPRPVQSTQQPPRKVG
jgi:hypothetical protein